MDRVGRLQDTASVQKQTLIHSLFVALVFFFLFFGGETQILPEGHR